MRNTLFISYLLIILIGSTNCANQRPPTGGEKDEDPPELISSTPANGTLNFKGKEIELQFNEAIKLNSAKEQIIVTPRLLQEYEIKYRKDKVIISLEAPLSDSTTYTFNFRESIQDLNEGNPAENLKLAFSTGNYLDSLQITGNTKSILTNKVIKDVTVSLYPVGDTLNPFEHPPLYFTKSNGKGDFQFDNLKNGNYFIVAVKDKNKNLYIDAKNEMYGFLSDTLFLSQNIDSLSIPLQQLDNRPLETISARQSGTIFQIKLNKYVSDYNLYIEDSIPLLHNFSNSEHKEIQVFNNGFDADSLLTIIEAYDTTYSQIRDTLFLKFEPTNRSPQKFQSQLNINHVVPTNGIVSGQITFNKPIAQYNYDSMYIYLDSLNQLYLDSSQITFNKFNDRLDFSYTLDPSLFEEKTDSTSNSSVQTKSPTTERAQKSLQSDTTNTLAGQDSTQTKTNKSKSKKDVKPYIVFEKNTFFSAEQDTSKRIKDNLEFKKLSTFATLLVEVQPSADQKFIVQLLNKNDEVVREVVNERVFSFKQLVPGDYRIRTIIDTNGNGRWDPGSFDNRTMPEPVIFFTNSEKQETITLRANWEVGPNIIQF
ncbi:MAG: Ig-like domain-containing protein [Fulvivirga sp.]